MPVLFSKLAAKLWLFKVKLVAVKANGCLLCREVFLKDRNILKLICEGLSWLIVFGVVLCFFPFSGKTEISHDVSGTKCSSWESSFVWH